PSRTGATTLGDEALAHLSESRRLADESGSPVLQFFARAPLGSALQVTGQLREAVAVSDEAERLRGGDPGWGPRLDLAPTEDLAPTDSSSPIARSRGPGSVGSERRPPPPGVPSRSRAGARTRRCWWRDWLLPRLAEASLGVGDRDGDREAAERALARARQHQTRVFEIVALLSWARVRRATDGAEGAAG